jgi:hypothetical protein
MPTKDKSDGSAVLYIRCSDALIKRIDEYRTRKGMQLGTLLTRTQAAMILLNEGLKEES